MEREMFPGQSETQETSYDGLAKMTISHDWEVASFEEANAQLEEIRAHDEALLREGYHRVDESEDIISGTGEDGTEFVAFVCPDPSGEISANIFVKGKNSWQYYGGNHDFSLSELEATLSRVHARSERE